MGYVRDRSFLLNLFPTTQWKPGTAKPLVNKNSRKYGWITVDRTQKGGRYETTFRLSYFTLIKNLFRYLSYVYNIIYTDASLRLKNDDTESPLLLKNDDTGAFLRLKK